MVQLKGHRSVGGMRASIYNAMPIEGVADAGRVHAGIRARARVGMRCSLQDLTCPNADPHAQPDRGRRACTASRARATRRQGGRASGRDHRALARHARDAIDSGERQGDRPRRRGHQQHSGRRDVEARRAGVQRAGRERQRGEGAGARRAADGGAQRRARARATSRRSTRVRRDLERASRTARSSSPASSCRIARSASSASARSAAWSPIRRSSSA